MNQSYFAIAQIILSIIIVVLVLLQERGGGMSGLLGGGDGGGSVYQTRRGFERVIFVSTIICVVLFAGLAIAQLFLA